MAPLATHWNWRTTPSPSHVWHWAIHLLMDTLSSGMHLIVGCGGRRDATATAGSGITSVSHTARFTGLGTTVSLLDLADNAVDADQLAADAVTVAKLDADNSPSDGQVPAYVDASGRMTWVDQTGGGAGDISQVIAGNGLSGGGDTGSVTLNVDVGEASFPTVPIVHGGTAGTSQSEAYIGLGITDVFDAAAWDGTSRSIVYGRLGGGAHTVLLNVEEFHGAWWRHLHSGTRLRLWR